MSYEIYETETFSKLYKSMEKEEREQLNKIKIQIKENPSVGKPLKFDWFREKKYGKYRIYYLIYEDIVAVFMVDISEKKYQQKVINTIKLFLNIYKDELNKLSRK